MHHEEEEIKEESAPEILPGKVVTLGERGPNLPLGTFDPSSGSWIRDMLHLPWKLSTEKKLGSLLYKNKSAKQMNLADHIAIILALLYDRLGVNDLSALDVEKKLFQRRAMISSMWMGDVYYAYVWLRVQSLGHELKTKITCPHCGKTYPFTGDLRTIRVRCFDSIEEARWQYKLRDPFKARGESIENFVMGPPRWSALEAAGQDVDGGALNVSFAKRFLTRSAIHEVPIASGTISLTEDEMGEITKRDFETIIAEIVGRTLGPNMAIEDNCSNPACEGELNIPIDWGYDSFFSGSSS